MAAQLTIDGREVQPAPAPERCEVLPLFSAPQTIPGQLPCPVLAERGSEPHSEPQPVQRESTGTADDAAADERAARERLRQIERMHRGAAKARERQWRERLREVLRETRARYPRCRCELRPGMSRAELQHLAGGCTDPQYVCPRLAAVRRLLARRESDGAS